MHSNINIQRRQWQPTPVLLPGKSHGQRNLVGCSPWGHEESGTTERLYFHFSLSCIGEGNGNPLQCSCLENPRDGGAWWAAVYGVAQSRTWLRWLSSSSSNINISWGEEGIKTSYIFHRSSRDRQINVENSRCSILFFFFFFGVWTFTLEEIIDLMKHFFQIFGVRSVPRAVLSPYDIELWNTWRNCFYVWS